MQGNKEKMLKLAKEIVNEVESEEVAGVQIRQVPTENPLIMGDTLNITITLKGDHESIENQEGVDGYYAGTMLCDH